MAILAECPMCHRKQAAKNRVCKCGEDLVKAKGNKKVKYWISYYLPRGKQKREYVGSFKELNGYSIEDARKAYSKRVVQKAENRLLDIKSDTRMTFQELTEWYLGLEKVKALACYWRRTLTLKTFNSEFGKVVVCRIKPVDLENYQAKRKAQGKADATIDQEIADAKTVVYKAFNNDLVSGDTLKAFKKVKKLLKKGSDVRDRILSREEYDRLVMNAPRHLKPILAVGYFTGMREGEILNLTWNKVDLKNRFIRLEPFDTKDRKPRNIPVCDELLEMLKGIPRSINDDHVFLHKGKPITYIYTALKTACRNTGIKYGRFVKGGFIFHDLRHTFNTNMRKAGVPESVIMEITGHSTREMFDRYNTIDEEDTQKAIAQLQGYLSQNSDQHIDQSALQS